MTHQKHLHIFIMDVIGALRKENPLKTKENPTPTPVFEQFRSNSQHFVLLKNGAQKQNFCKEKESPVCFIGKQANSIGNLCPLPILFELLKMRVNQRTIGPVSLT